MHNSDFAIGVIPPEIRPTPDWGRISLDDLRWPVGRPKRLASGTLRDMRTTDHVLVYMKTPQHFVPRLGFDGHVSLLLSEPKALHNRHWRTLRLTWRRFHRVLTCNPELANALPNGIRFPYGSTWIIDLESVDLTKHKILSLIASAKRDLPGHKLRHEIVEWLDGEGLDYGADVMGRGYRPFEVKADGLAPYRYSIVIENVREPTYFTEKIVDALSCKTVPIYWGAPDIHDYFNPHGMIVVENAADVKRAVASMSEADYISRHAAIEDNYERAKYFAAHEKRACEAVIASMDAG